MNNSIQPTASPTQPSKPTDGIFYLWPYTPESVAEGTRHSAGLIPVVLGTGAAAMAAAPGLFQALLTGNCSNWYSVIGAVAMVAILTPLYIKGHRNVLFDRIRITAWGISFEQSEKELRFGTNKHLPWGQIEKIYLIPAKSKANVLSSVLVVAACGYKKKIPLKKIRCAANWRRLVAALRQHRPNRVGDLDETLLDGLQEAEGQDPTFTRLWLETLNAPPKRERLKPLPAGAQLQQGVYCITDQIGTGGQGTAYLAETTKQVLAAEKTSSTPVKQVVLKEYILPVYVDTKVRRQALEAFEHEASMLRSLGHPSIVSMLDSFVEDHRAYLVLEYVNGQSLRELVQSKGPLPESACLKLAIDMCDILQYLHTRVPPIIHQDFTPDNLLLSGDGRLKLIDFMVAKQQTSESCTETVVGKHHYMPPEQFRGSSGQQSDIYALGATLYFMLTGNDPEPMSPSHPILSNENVSAELDSIVARATALDSTHRFDSAEILKAALQSLPMPAA
jgi:tRNA A-37 threonylcarbamoyl transferase component Bud32